MKEIELTRGYVAVVDDEDYPWLSRFKWSARPSGRTCYAQRKSNSKMVAMHQLLVEITNGQEIDHRDGNGLNNRRKNLRAATRRQNSQNRTVQAHSSQYKGVSYRADVGKWRARLRHRGCLLVCGTYASEHDAGRAYNTAALELFGDFARLNIISPAKEDRRLL